MIEIKTYVAIFAYIFMSAFALLSVQLIPEEKAKYLYIILPKEQTFAQTISQIKKANAQIVGTGAIDNSYILYSETGNLTKYFNLNNTRFTLNPIFAQGCTDKRLRIDA